MEKGQVEGVHVLRAVAATMVVMHHAQMAFPGSGWPTWGAAGVDLFFVISGFVMALTTQARPSPMLSGRVDQAASFAWKRILRIVPLYWLALLWTARRDLFEPTLVKDLFFIPRLNPAIPGMIKPVLTQGWTLNFEMAFYTIFAVGMLCGRGRLVVIGIALAFLPLLNPLGMSGVAADFYSDSIVLEFGLGIILFHIVTKKGFGRLPQWAYICAGAAGFAALAFGYDHAPRGIVEGLPAMLIVWASMRGCYGWLRWKPLVVLGDASYAIYLFHWASFGALKPIIRIMGPNHNTIVILIHVVTGVLAGVAVHLVIETRMNGIIRWFRRGGKSQPAPAVAIESAVVDVRT